MKEYKQLKLIQKRSFYQGYCWLILDPQGKPYENLRFPTIQKARKFIDSVIGKLESK